MGDDDAGAVGVHAFQGFLDGAYVDVVQARDQLGEGGFACSTGTNQVARVGGKVIILAPVRLPGRKPVETGPGVLLVIREGAASNFHQIRPVNIAEQSLV